MHLRAARCRPSETLDPAGFKGEEVESVVVNGFFSNLPGEKNLLAIRSPSEQRIRTSCSAPMACTLRSAPPAAGMITISA